MTNPMKQQADTRRPAGSAPAASGVNAETVQRLVLRRQAERMTAQLTRTQPSHRKEVKE